MVDGNRLNTSVDYNVMTLIWASPISRLTAYSRDAKPGGRPLPVKVVQERLGHASAKTTLDVYAKAVPSIQPTAAERMPHILGDWVTFGVKPEGDNEENVVK